MELLLWIIGKIQKKVDVENQEHIILLLGIAIGITIYILQIYFTFIELPQIKLNSDNANVMGFLAIAIGILLLMIGNILPKVKKNETIGLRLPWTLEDNKKWIKGQKFAARTTVVTGFMLILIGIVSKGSLCGILLFSMLGIWTFVLILV